MKYLKLILLLGLFLSLYSHSSELKILTFNVWDLKAYGITVAQDIKERFKILPQKLTESGADIIALQEIWQNKRKKRLAEVMKKNGYPYSFYENSGISIGNGLMVLSKYPIAKSEVSEPYVQHTQIDEIISRKAAFHLLIDLPSLGKIDFYTTHLGAVGFDEKHDQYNKVQKEKLLNQIVAFSDWVKITQNSSNVIITGDFNMHYQEYDHEGHFKPEFAKDYAFMVKKLCNRGSALDTFLVANNLDVSNTAHYTYSRTNPYVASGHFANAPSEVNDYIFVCENSEFNLLSSSLAFTEAIPVSYKEQFKLRRLPLMLSDHYGVLTSFSY